MIKVPEKAPRNDFDWNIIKKMSSGEMYKLMKKANEKYLYWDEFKHLTFPEGVKPEDAWSYFRDMRQFQTKSTPIEKKGKRKFTYWLPGNMQKILHFVDQNAGGQMFSEGLEIPSGEVDKYIVSSLMEEAIASSQLEGAATTRKKAKDMLRSGRKPANNAEQMILNNYRTITKIIEMRDEKLSKELILRIQEMMTRETLEDPTAAGRFRRKEEEICVVDQTDGTLLHEPPDAEEINERIQILIDYANEEDVREFVHPIIKALIIHFGVAYIHPFVDGNGRTARALFYWYMIKNEYWLFEYLPISRIIKRKAVQYAKSYLYTEIDDSDLTYFLVFNLNCVNKAVEEFMTYLKTKQKEVKETAAFIRQCPDLNYRQTELLRHAILHSDASYTIRYHGNVHDIVYQTARTDLMEMEEKGFLKRTKKGNKFVFVPTENIRKKIIGNMPD